MNTQIEELAKLTCIRPQGRLDFDASAGFQSQVEQAIAAAAKRSAAVVVDCAGLEYVSSAGLRVFLVAARSAKSASIGFITCGLSATVKEVFEVSGFSRIIDVQPDFAAASAKCGGA